MAASAVGLIGLGLLGSAMAERLLTAGQDLVGWDIDENCRARFVTLGGTVLSSAEEVASRCSRLLLSLPDSNVVEAVIADIQARLPAQALLIDTTTGSPDRSAEIGKKLAKKGIGYLDATVAGSSEEARRGNVLMMVGGEQNHYRACLDLFHAISRLSYHVGPWGSGARMKLVVNLVLGLNRAVLAEGLCFAKHLGLDSELSLEILREGPTFSRVMETKGRKMLEHEFSPQARLAQHWKDVRLILAAGESAGAKTPLSRIHESLLARLVEQGHGAEDNSAVIRAFED